MKSDYREDIDGLRAISVLSVILNHAGIGLFSGGFIGVDIFFVISGYLITNIIIKDIYADKFSFINFYERRIRRILPPLFTMVAFTVMACAILYDPEKFKEFGKSLIATTLFASNINFWKESGYFDTSSQLKPLLHTWSLAVEEQFYIFFPLFMVFLIRYFEKQAKFILIATALISFGFSTDIVSGNPTAAFYLAHLRAWELIMGAIIALNILPRHINEKYRNLLGGIGLTIILVSIFQYSKNTQFPGITALTPVIGAALIIYSGGQGKSVVNKILGLPVLVFIGRISYSLYLWHWPVLIFGKYYTIRPMTNLEIMLEIILIFILSTLSWRFIETPFRSTRFLQTKQIYIFAGGVMTLALITGATIYLNKGFPSRYKADPRAEVNKKNDRWDFKECNINYTDNPETIMPCKIGVDSQIPSFLIWGDSHAPTMGKAIHISATKTNLAGYLTYSPGCPTLLDMVPNPQIGDLQCIDYNHMVLRYLDKHPEITTIILVNRWTPWVQGTRYGGEEGQKLSLIDTLNELPAPAANEALFTLGLERTIKTLKSSNLNIFVVAPIPEVGYDVPSANFIATQTGRDLNKIIAPSLDEFLNRNKETFDILNLFEKNYGISIVEPWKILCVDSRCRVTVNGLPLYKDDDHLSILGSELITTVFDPPLEFIYQSTR